MLEIVPNSFVIFPNSLSPTIKFQVKDMMDSSTIPIRISGSVFSEDGKYIADAVELPLEELANMGFGARESGYAITVGDIRSAPNAVTYYSNLMFPLDTRSLDHIEELRHKSKKGDVIFNLLLTLTVLRSNIRLGDFSISSQDPNNVVTSSRGTRQSGVDILVNFDRDGHQQLFSYKIMESKIQHVIKASDWVNDYQVPLGIGKFLIVEVPQPELTDIMNVTMTSDENNFKARLDSSYKTLQDMESKLREGEWANVVSELRGMELLKKDIKGFIQNMISQSTAMDINKVVQLTTAIDNIVNYASELHHKIGSSGQVKEVYTGGKEDAYMAYMLATALTNLLARKFSRSLESKKGQI